MDKGGRRMGWIGGRVRVLGGNGLDWIRGGGEGGRI